MYIYIHTYIYIYTYICIFIYVYIYTYIHVYIYIYVYMYIYMYIHMYTYMYVCIYVRVYIHVYISCAYTVAIWDMSACQRTDLISCVRDTHIYTYIYRYIHFTHLYGGHLMYVCMSKDRSDIASSWHTYVCHEPICLYTPNSICLPIIWYAVV